MVVPGMQGESSMRYALALLLAGCMLPGVGRYHPGQDEASRAAWEIYGHDEGDDPPDILWVEGSDLDCVQPSCGLPGFTWRGECLGGLTEVPWVISVALAPDQPLASTALAHELEHADQAQRWVFDPRHHRREWAPGGIVDQAREAM